jgi:protein SCO1
MPATCRVVSLKFPMERSPISAAIIALTLSVLMIALAGLAPARAGVDAKVRGTPQPITPFSLQQASGAPFTAEDFKGRWSLVVLGFTHCPDVCPFTLQNLAQVEEELSLRVSPERKPQVVFIGVDPDRDHKVIGEYVKHFSDHFIGATGDWEEVARAVDTLGGYVRITGKEKDPDDYRVFHSASISVVDPEGRLVAGVNPPMPPSETATFLSELMIKHARKTAKQ